MSIFFKMTSKAYFVSWVMLGLASSVADTRAEDVPALTPQIIAAYQAKLTHANDQKAILDGRAACLARDDGALVERRDAAQLQLGRLREQGATLDAKYGEYKSRVNLLNQSLTDNYNDFIKIKGKLQAVMAEITKIQDEHRTCATVGAFIPLVNLGCAGVAIYEQLSGDAASLRTAMIEAESRMKRAQGAVDELNAQLKQASGALSSAWEEQAKVRASVHDLEISIAKVDQALSGIRTQSQSIGKLVDLLQTVIGTAATIDAADGRARTARAALELSKQLDETLSRSEAVLAGANAALPAGMTSSCPAR